MIFFSLPELVTCKYSVLFFPSRVVVIAGDFICLEKKWNLNAIIICVKNPRAECSFWVLTKRRSLSGTLKPPVIWQKEGTVDLEAPGCKLSNFPVNQWKFRLHWIFSVSIRYTAGKKPVTAKTNLSLCFECVGVQSIHVIEDHVIIQRDIGAGKKKQQKTKKNNKKQ